MRRRDFLKVLGALIAIAPTIKITIKRDDTPHPYMLRGGISYAYNPAIQEYYQSGNVEYQERWAENETMHVRDKRTGKTWDTGLRTKDGWLL